MPPIRGERRGKAVRDNPYVRAPAQLAPPRVSEIDAITAGVSAAAGFVWNQAPAIFGRFMGWQPAAQATLALSDVSAPPLAAVKEQPELAADPAPTNHANDSPAPGAEAEAYGTPAASPAVAVADESFASFASAADALQSPAAVVPDTVEMESAMETETESPAPVEPTDGPSVEKSASRRSSQTGSGGKRTPSASPARSSPRSSPAASTPAAVAAVEAAYMRRDDGEDSTRLRKQPTGSANDDDWVDDEASADSGEPVSVLRRTDGFALVRTEDGLEGWVREKYVSDQPPAPLPAKTPSRGSTKKEAAEVPSTVQRRSNRGKVSASRRVYWTFSSRPPYTAAVEHVLTALTQGTAAPASALPTTRRGSRTGTANAGSRSSRRSAAQTPGNNADAVAGMTVKVLREQLKANGKPRTIHCTVAMSLHCRACRVVAVDAAHGQV